MSLNGTLDIFPIEEIMRLLARSQQAGCLRITGPAEGRIYIDSGSITFAAAGDEDAIRNDLIASGLATEESLGRLGQIGGTLNDALTPGAASTALAELVREHTVESLYRVRKPQAGSFSFEAGRNPQYPTGQSFDLETIVSQADRRAAEWADIETVVTDQTVPWRMVPTIDEESVNLSDSAWRFLAAMDGSCSVRELAIRLGETTFQTSRRMAEMSRARLVEEVGASVLTEDVAVSEPYQATYAEPANLEADPEYQTPSQPVWEQPEAPAEPSWWGAGDTAEQEAESIEAAEPPARDTFLESVFSELDTEQDPADTDEACVEAEDEAVESEDDSDDDNDPDNGFGLLRRRGLGAAFRELADS